MIGTKLAHYEITSHIGSGGMGDVYQATDTKLGRSVAIKFLPEAFSHDTERVARVQREARVLASVNHSNIAAILGLEETDSQCKNNTRLFHNTLFERRVIPSVQTFRKIIVA
jgi:serine/threonine protein kinase